MEIEQEHVQLEIIHAYSALIGACEKDLQWEGAMAILMETQYRSCGDGAGARTVGDHPCEKGFQLHALLPRTPATAFDTGVAGRRSACSWRSSHAVR